MACNKCKSFMGTVISILSLFVHLSFWNWSNLFVDIISQQELMRKRDPHRENVENIWAICLPILTMQHIRESPSASHAMRKSAWNEHLNYSHHRNSINLAAGSSRYINAGMFSFIVLSLTGHLSCWNWLVPSADITSQRERASPQQSPQKFLSINLWAEVKSTYKEHS